MAIVRMGRTHSGLKQEQQWEAERQECMGVAREQLGWGPAFVSRQEVDRHKILKILLTPSDLGSGIWAPS